MNRIEARIRLNDLPTNVRFSRAERETLRRMYRGGNIRDRRYCAEALLAGCGVESNMRFIFKMCDEMIPDRADSVRWQALGILGRYPKTHPAELWPLVVKWGTSGVEDIRIGVACCLLEHVLEHHFAEYFPKAAAVAERNARFLQVLSTCWPFGQTEFARNARRLKDTIDRLETIQRGKS